LVNIVSIKFLFLMVIPSSTLRLISQWLPLLLAALVLLGTPRFEFQIKGQTDGALTTQSSLQQKSVPTVSAPIDGSLNGKTPGELATALTVTRGQNFLDQAPEFIKLKWVNPIHEMTSYGFSCLCGGVANA
jgi:hypothetical protein